MMEYVKGRVLDGDQLLAGGIEITVEWIQERSGQSSWRGCFIVPNPWPVDRGGSLRLEFEDGRSGEIAVRKTKPSTSAETTVLFTGKGALQ